MPSVAHIIRRRHNRKQRRRDQRTHSRLWTGVIVGLLLLAIVVPLGVVFGLAGVLYLQAVSLMPSPADTIYLDPIIGPTNFYDSSASTLLYAVQDPLGDERQWVDIDQLPAHVVDATIQMEDPDFLETGSFDAGITLTRLWRYILGVDVRRDTSLAGRLATQALVPPADGYGLDSNLLHIAMSAEVMRRYTPRRVLEWYLNTAWYGNDAYGIDAAAQVYFGKRAADLSLDEAALLAAIPLAPQFNPFDNVGAARDRQLDLLRQLRAAGKITSEQFDSHASLLTPIRSNLDQVPTVAPEFAIYARSQAEDLLYSIGLDGARLVSRGGLQITTSLDLDLYYQAECTLRAHLAQLNGQPASATTLHGQPCVGTGYLRDVFGIDPASSPDQGAILLLDVQTGAIRAMVGDALAYDRQPGPTIQPFVYLTGFLSGNFTPATMLLDIPQTLPGPAEGLIYTPVNADQQYRGPINLRDAMAAGLQAPVAYVADREGLSSVIAYSHRMGFNSLEDASLFDLSLIERGGRASLLDVTYAYSVFASMGFMQGVDAQAVARNYRTRDPVAVLRIADSSGNVLWEYDADRIALSRTAIIAGDMAYLVNHILSDSGTRNRVLGIDPATLDIARPAALVNGVTRGAAESWTVGYTPQLVTGVTLTRQDGAALSVDAFGTQAASPVWQALMRFAHERYSLAPATWARPQTIQEYTVCDKSGLLPGVNSRCPRRTEIFLAQVPPVQEDIYWRSFEVNSATRQLASSSTPSHLIIEEVYFVPPDAAMDWWVSNNLALPPTEYDALSVPAALRSVQILQPLDFSYVSGVVDIRGVVDTERLESFRLRYGEGLRPTNWFEIGEPQTTFTEGISLGMWDTTALNGFYTLELSVRFNDGTTESAPVQITVDNTPPVIALRTGDSGEDVLFRWPSQSSIVIVAEVSDAYPISRVEFYQNGVLVGTDVDFPYSYTYTITGPALEVFGAAAFDEGGNSASIERQIEIIRSGG